MSKAPVFTLRREVRKRVPLAGHGSGFTTVPDGHEDVTVQVEVDHEAIARRLFEQAARSRGQRSRYMNGAVLVRVVSRKRVER